MEQQINLSLSLSLSLSLCQIRKINLKTMGNLGKMKCILYYEKQINNQREITYPFIRIA